MRGHCLAALAFLVTPALVHAQNTSIREQQPHTGFSLPDIGGTLSYSLTGSENLLFGTYNGGTNQFSAYTNFSGNLAYLSRSARHPFSALYTGGYQVGTGGFPNNTFQDLAVSQGFYGQRVSFLIADYISYTPQTPDVGLSGVPGTGDVSIAPVSVTGQTGLGLLTTYSSRVTNTVSATFSVDLTSKTSVSLTGDDVIERYTGANSSGIGNDQYAETALVTHKLDTQTSFGGGYSYYSSQFNYGANGANTGYGYNTKSVFGNYSRQLTQRWNLQLSAGPQFVSDNGGDLLSSSSTSVAASGSLVYGGKVYTDSLSFNRSTSNGNGVVIGAEQNAVTFVAARRVARLWSVAANVGYNHSSSLPNSTLPAYTSDTVVFGGQVSYQISRDFSAFGSYTLQHQSFDGFAASGIAFNGNLQNVAFGITYAPKPLIEGK